MLTNTTREMVRYSKIDNGQKKNVLFTFRKNDSVFFGVARCRLQVDKFDKELGLTIAKGRALKALELLEKQGSFLLKDQDQIEFVGSIREAEPTKGFVKLENIKSLIAWFKSFK